MRGDEIDGELKTQGELEQKDIQEILARKGI